MREEEFNMKIDIKYFRHQGNDTFVGKCVKVEVVDKLGKKLVRIWFATSVGIIATSFPYEAGVIYEDSEMFQFIKNLLGEEPQKALTLEDLVGMKCYLETDNSVNYLGYIYSTIITTYPIFKTEEQREEFYSNCPYEHVWGANRSIEESSVDYEFENFYEPTEDDFLNYCNNYDSN